MMNKTTGNLNQDLIKEIKDEIINLSDKEHQRGPAEPHNIDDIIAGDQDSFSPPIKNPSLDKP